MPAIKGGKIVIMKTRYSYQFVLYQSGNLFPGRTDEDYITSDRKYYVVGAYRNWKFQLPEGFNLAKIDKLVSDCDSIKPSKLIIVWNDKTETILTEVEEHKRIVKYSSYTTDEAGKINCREWFETLNF